MNDNLLKKLRSFEALIVGGMKGKFCFVPRLPIEI